MTRSLVTFFHKSPTAIEVKCVSHVQVDRKHQDHREDGSNAVLRSFLRESFEERRPGTNRINREINSRYPQLREMEQGFSNQPYIGGKGLYVSKELLSPDYGIENVFKFDALDQEIEKMTRNMDNVVRKAEESINALQTSIGKRLSMEDTTSQHESNEWRYENTRLVRRKNSVETSYVRATYTKEKDEVREYCQFVEDNTMEEPEGTYEVTRDTIEGLFQSFL